MSRKKGCLLILFIWIIAGVLSFPNVISARVETKYFYSGVLTRRRFCSVDFQYKFLYDNLLFVAQYAIPLLVLTYTYARILLALRNIKFPSAARVNISRNHMRDKQKAIKMLGLVVVIFMVSWFPYQGYVNMQSSSTQRGRSQTDSVVNSSTIGVENLLSTTDLPYRNRLYQLFALIDKEFENLYLENYQLKLKLGQNPDAPLSDAFKLNDNSSLILNEISQKLSGKKHYAQQRQKWKSALKPPGRLVTSLKSGNVETSKSQKVGCFNGHLDAVFDLASCTLYGGNGRTVIGTASADQTSRIFSTTGDCFLHYTGHNGAVNSIALRPDSSTNDQFFALTASGDRSVHLWRGSLDSNTGVANSSEDDLDATSEKINDVDDENFSRVPLQIRQPVQIFSGHSEAAIVCADWLAGGEQIISASWDKTANVYDIENPQTVLNHLSGHEGELTFCSTHRTDKIIATASKDYTFRLWDMREAMKHVWDLRNMRSPNASSRFESGVNRLGASKHNVIAAPLDNRNVFIVDLNGNRIGRLHRGNVRNGKD
ncbi:WD repeat-containing protein 37 [Aphelenchoides besseyi]|nr:WD repeat-containing protein 37 [Aphelenchoides besseyi]